MDFDEVSEMNRQLDLDMQNAMTNLANDILKGLKELIDTEIYGSYEPQFYNRSYQLFEALRIDVIRNGIGDWTLDIYVTKDNHKFNPTWQGYSNSLDDIFSMFAEDGFYGRDRSIDVFKMTQEEWIINGKIMNRIKQYLSQWFD